MRDKGQEAAGLIQALGPDTIPGLMDIYSQDEAVGGRRVLFNLLCLFGEPAVREAAEDGCRTRGTYYVRNLLILIRRAGNARPLPRTAAAAASGPGGEDRSAQHAPEIQGPRGREVASERDPCERPRLCFPSRCPGRTIPDDGRHRGCSGEIKRAILFETDYAENEEIIRALGEIGDPRAVPDLEKLPARRGRSIPRSLLHMKETFYESLVRYPRNAIAGLSRSAKD